MWQQCQQRGLWELSAPPPAFLQPSAAPTRWGACARGSSRTQRDTPRKNPTRVAKGRDGMTGPVKMTRADVGFRWPRRRAQRRRPRTAQHDQRTRCYMPAPVRISSLSRIARQARSEGLFATVGRELLRQGAGPPPGRPRRPAPNEKVQKPERPSGCPTARPKPSMAHGSWGLHPKAGYARNSGDWGFGAQNPRAANSTEDSIPQPS